MDNMFSSEFFKYDKDGYLIELDHKWGAKQGKRLDNSLMLLFQTVEKLEKQVAELQAQVKADHGEYKIS